MTTSYPSQTSVDSANSFVEGQVLLDRYRLQRILGQGGMGVVWLARDEKLEREVALKFLPSVVVNDRASLLELKRETKRTLELTHPNIVRTYDFVQDSTIAGISMEYVDSDTLRNRKITRPDEVFQPSELGDWVLQLCEALDYAHHHAAIVHRDLKPANLLINGRNQVKVADFGISRSLSESVTQVTGRQGASGTLVYMSPQQLAGDEGHPLDDVYAVGSTLYELCTKRPPFYMGDIAGQVYHKAAPSMARRREELGVPAGEIPEHWEKTVAACLAKNPLDRPQSAGEIAVRLGIKEAASLYAPSQAFPAPSAETHEASSFTEMVRIPRPAAGAPAASTPFTTSPAFVPKSKNPALMLGGIAAAIVVAGAAGWLAFGPHGAPAHAQKSRPAEATPHPNLGTGTGTIFVESVPKEAQVILDGEPVGRTPMSWEKLNAGPHTLAVTLEGYDVFAERVEVKDSNLTRVPKIVLQRSKGEIEVTTSAPATLTVAGPDNPLNPQPVPNPWKAEDMPTGEYRISIMRAGWQPILKTEKLKTGSPLRVRYDLSPGTLEIVNLAAGTMVTVNNKLAGQVPAGAKSLKVQDVQPGEVEYLLELNGTKKTGKAMIVAGQPEVADGKLSTVTATPAPKPPAQQQQQQQQPRRAPDEPSSRREWMKWIPGA